MTETGLRPRRSHVRLRTRPRRARGPSLEMDAVIHLKPDLQLTVATAQAIVDQAVPGRAVATILRLHGGEIAAVYEIAFVDPAHAPLILKVYPDELHWKMQKEVTVLGLIKDRLSVSVPRILLADDSKRLLGLNLTLMTKLEGAVLGRLETTLTTPQRLSAYAQIGGLLREFHGFPMEASGYIGAKSVVMAHATNHEYLTHQFQRKLKEFTERGGDAGLAERVAGYAAGRAELLGACTGGAVPQRSARRQAACHNIEWWPAAHRRSGLRGRARRRPTDGCRQGALLSRRGVKTRGP